MSDTENHTPTQDEKKAAEKLSQAQDAFQKAFSAFLEAAMDYGWESGWTDGYDSGWTAAFEHLRKQEVAMREAAKLARPRTPAGPQPSLPFLNIGGGERRTTADLVLEFIKDNPGKRGVDIANYFESSSPPIMPERTVRTALHRMRDKQIKNVGGKWYAADYPITDRDRGI